MQIVSIGDNLQEMSNPIFWKKKKKNILTLCAEILPKVLSVKSLHWSMRKMNPGISFNLPKTRKQKRMKSAWHYEVK